MQHNGIIFSHQRCLNYLRLGVTPCPALLSPLLSPVPPFQVTHNELYAQPRFPSHSITCGLLGLGLQRGSVSEISSVCKTSFEQVWLSSTQRQLYTCYPHPGRVPAAGECGDDRAEREAKSSRAPFPAPPMTPHTHSHQTQRPVRPPPAELHHLGLLHPSLPTLQRRASLPGPAPRAQLHFSLDFLSSS